MVCMLLFKKAIRSTFILNTDILASKDVLVITVAGNKAIHRQWKSAPFAGQRKTLNLINPENSDSPKK